MVVADELMGGLLIRVRLEITSMPSNHFEDETSHIQIISGISPSKGITTNAGTLYSVP